jgi:hypothetical protein
VIYKVNEGRPNIADQIVNGKIDLVINTPLGRDSFFDDGRATGGDDGPGTVYYDVDRGDGGGERHHGAQIPDPDGAVASGLLCRSTKPAPNDEPTTLHESLEGREIPKGGSVFVAFAFVRGLGGLSFPAQRPFAGAVTTVEIRRHRYR